MNKLSTFCLIIVVALGIAGCGIPRSTKTNPDELNLNDLTSALGITWWNISIPSTYDETDLFEIQIKTGDGQTFYGCTVSGINGGEKIKLLVWPSDNKNDLKTAIIGGSFSARSSITNLFKGSITYPSPAGRTAQLDDMLMKGVDRGALTPYGELKDGEYALYLAHVEHPN